MKSNLSRRLAKGILGEDDAAATQARIAATTKLDSMADRDLLAPQIHEAINCIAERLATPDDIDAMMKLGANHPVEPLALCDLIGLDVVLNIMETLHDGFDDPKYRPGPLLKQMVRAGYRRRKSGRGLPGNIPPADAVRGEKMPSFSAADGTSLFYSDAGEGDGLPLLALAGLTRDGHDFDYLARHLAHDVRLIRLDSRGRGRSEWTGPDSYSVGQESADALALLDHLEVERAAIIGSSRGGLLGMVMAATAPGRVAGLCLNDVGPVLERDGLMRIGAYVGVTPSVATLDEVADRMQAAMPGFAHVPALRWQEETVRHYVQHENGIGLTYDPALRIPFDEAMKAPLPPAWELFDACAGLPLALIRGAASDVLSAQTAAQMQARRPDMHFAEVPHRGHIPFLDEPEALACVEGWLGHVRASWARPAGGTALT